MTAPATPVQPAAEDPAPETGPQPLRAATLRLTVVPTPQPPVDPQPVLRLVLPGARSRGHRTGRVRDRAPRTRPRGSSRASSRPGRGVPTSLIPGSPAAGC